MVEEGLYSQCPLPMSFLIEVPAFELESMGFAACEAYLEEVGDNITIDATRVVVPSNVVAISSHTGGTGCHIVDGLGQWHHPVLASFYRPLRAADHG